jgi:hypothetical protein
MFVMKVADFWNVIPCRYIKTFGIIALPPY